MLRSQWLALIKIDITQYSCFSRSYYTCSKFGFKRRLSSSDAIASNLFWANVVAFCPDHCKVKPFHYLLQLTFCILL